MMKQQLSTDDVFDPFQFDDEPKDSPKQQHQSPETTTNSNNNDQKQLHHADDDEIFDPFGLGSKLVSSLSMNEDNGNIGAPKEESLSTPSPTVQPPPKVNRLTNPPDDILNTSSAASKTATERTTSPLLSKKRSKVPPKVNIKVSIHEDVSSMAMFGHENEGSSQITVDGAVKVQVQCSDAFDNSPFTLITTTGDGDNNSSNTKFSFHPSPDNKLIEKIVKPEEMPITTNQNSSTDNNNLQLHKISVPKSGLGYIPIGKYSLVENVKHMPILVERKVSLVGMTCHIMVQIRSKLNNVSDMEDFSIAVAIPEKIDGSTVQVTRGDDGVWNPLLRTIKWKLPVLMKGESYMVSAQADLWSPIDIDSLLDEASDSIDADSVMTGKTQLQVQAAISFPVMLRCTSSGDQVSSIQFNASESIAHPAHITCTTTKSFRLLHRLT